MKKLIIVLCIIGFVSCKQDKNQKEEEVILWTPYHDSAEVAANANHEIGRMQYKLIQSKVLD
ncbi:MAG: amidase, partial [Maribacter sp.]